MISSSMTSIVGLHGIADLPLFLNGDDTAQILLAIEYGLPLDLPISRSRA